MTDPPPRKIGSLRDRIAAFENKGPAPTPERAPPAPRPKPAGMHWKPRAASPPPPDDASTGGGAGLSAADAKESITKAGSLKDRMAALQGLHAFGGAAPAPATSPPPRPSGEKPRWKPPVATPSTQHSVSSPPEEKSEHEAAAASVEEHPVSPGQTKEEDETKRDDKDEASSAAEQTADEPQEPDAEEEERRRRAAIAARMARLGGARIGFAPPVIGKKPEVKKHEDPKPEEAKEEAKAATETEPTVTRMYSAIAHISIRAHEVIIDSSCSAKPAYRRSHISSCKGNFWRQVSHYQCLFRQPLTRFHLRTFRTYQCFCLIAVISGS